MKQYLLLTFPICLFRFPACYAIRKILKPFFIHPAKSKSEASRGYSAVELHANNAILLLVVFVCAMNYCLVWVT